MEAEAGEAAMANKIRRPAVARLAAKLQSQNPLLTDAEACERAKSIVTNPNGGTPSGAQTTRYKAKNGS